MTFSESLSKTMKDGFQEYARVNSIEPIVYAGERYLKTLEDIDTRKGTFEKSDAIKRTIEKIEEDSGKEILCTVEPVKLIQLLEFFGHIPTNFPDGYEFVLDAIKNKRMFRKIYGLGNDIGNVERKLEKRQALEAIESLVSLKYD